MTVRPRRPRVTMPPKRAREPGATRRFLLDTAERTARTFAQGFLAVVGLDAVSAGFNPSLRDKAFVGLLSGGLAVLTAFAAEPVGAPDSASFLPADLDPPQP